MYRYSYTNNVPNESCVQYYMYVHMNVYYGIIKAPPEENTCIQQYMNVCT